jgi:hypothetical protein
MIAVSIWGIAGTALNLGISYDTTPWHWGRKFLLVVCYTLQSYVTLDLAQKIRIVGIVLDTFARKLRYLPEVLSRSGILSTFENVFFVQASVQNLSEASGSQHCHGAPLRCPTNLLFYLHARGMSH